MVASDNAPRDGWNGGYGVSVFFSYSNAKQGSCVVLNATDIEPWLLQNNSYCDVNDGAVTGNTHVCLQLHTGWWRALLATWQVMNLHFPKKPNRTVLHSSIRSVAPGLDERPWLSWRLTGNVYAAVHKSCPSVRRTSPNVHLGPCKQASEALLAFCDLCATTRWRGIYFRKLFPISGIVFDEGWWYYFSGKKCLEENIINAYRRISCLIQGTAYKVADQCRKTNVPRLKHRLLPHVWQTFERELFCVLLLRRIFEVLVKVAVESGQDGSEWVFVGYEKWLLHCAIETNVRGSVKYPENRWFFV